MPFDRLDLSGMDMFQWVLERHIRQCGGNSHEARLFIEVAGILTVESIAHSILQYQQLAFVSTCRLKINHWPGSFYWSASDLKPVIHLVDIGDTEDPDRFAAQHPPIDIQCDPPLAIYMGFTSQGNTWIVAVFHHLFFDFQGIQQWLYALVKGEDVRVLTLRKKKEHFWKSFLQVSQVIGWSFRQNSRHSLQWESDHVDGHPIRIGYRTIHFNSSEVAHLERDMEHYPIGLNESLFFLVKSAHAFSKIAASSAQKNIDPIIVQMPVSTRGISDQNAMNGNRIGMVFFKFKERNFRDMVYTAIKQMRHQATLRIPKGYARLTSWFRYVPVWFYLAMIRLPSAGKMASFGFSFLGKTFPHQVHLIDHLIRDIRTYPTNMIHPGITLVWYTYRGAHRLCVSWDRTKIDEKAIDRFVQIIKVVQAD